MAQFLEAFNKMNEDFARAGKSEKGEAYSNLATTLQRFEASLREYIQHTTKGEINAIMLKLKSAQSLTSDELDKVKLWVIGDAEFYTRLENNFVDWMNELKRLINEINKYQSNDPNIQTASKLRGLLQDGIRVLADIFFFLQQKERIENFTNATEEITPEEGMTLARILEQKLRSPDY
jgi:hypothetical protein